MPAAVGCPEDAAWIHIPGNGQLVFEATTVWGTASISNFSFYRFEIKRTEPGSEFAPIGNIPSQWSTARWGTCCRSTLSAAIIASA